MSEKYVIRIYASYDADLISLYAQGIPMATFAKKVLHAYAYGETLRYVIPKFEGKTVNRTCRTRITVSDEKVLAVLHSVRSRKKNLFIKELMRNALVRQNLSAFFDSKELIDRENRINAELASDEANVLLKRGRRSISLPEVLGDTSPKNDYGKKRVMNKNEGSLDDVPRESGSIEKSIAETICSVPDEPLFSGIHDIKVKSDVPDDVSEDTEVSTGNEDDILAMLRSMTEEF